MYTTLQGQNLLVQENVMSDSTKSTDSTEHGLEVYKSLFQSCKLQSSQSLEEAVRLKYLCG